MSCSLCCVEHFLSSCVSRSPGPSFVHRALLFALVIPEFINAILLTQSNPWIWGCLFCNSQGSVSCCLFVCSNRPHKKFSPVKTLQWAPAMVASLCPRLWQRGKIKTQWRTRSLQNMLQMAKVFPFLGVCDGEWASCVASFASPQTVHFSEVEEGIVWLKYTD